MESDSNGHPGVVPLVQHVEAEGEPWKVVAASMLLCRTRGDVARWVIAAMFRRWPTAREMADADEGELREMIRPLGFARLRAARLKKTALFFSADLRPSPDDVATLPGVGKYVLDAYRLVVLGDRTIEPEDPALRRWLKETGG